MASTPGLNELEARIAELGGDDWVFDQIAAGVRPKTLMDEIGYSRTMVYRWLKHGPRKEERQRRWREAQREAADAYADESIELLEELADKPTSELTPALVALTGKRSEGRRWLASIRNPQEYGAHVGPGLTINIGSLHLDALRQIGSVQQPALPSGETIDAELVEDGS